MTNSADFGQTPSSAASDLVYTVCSGLFVPIFRVIAVIFWIILHHINIVLNCLLLILDKAKGHPMDRILANYVDLTSSMVYVKNKHRRSFEFGEEDSGYNSQHTDMKIDKRCPAVSGEMSLESEHTYTRTWHDILCSRMYRVVDIPNARQSLY